MFSRKAIPVLLVASVIGFNLCSPALAEADKGFYQSIENLEKLLEIKKLEARIAQCEAKKAKARAQIEKAKAEKACARLTIFKVNKEMETLSAGGDRTVKESKEKKSKKKKKN